MVGDVSSPERVRTFDSFWTPEGLVFWSSLFTPPQPACRRNLHLFPCDGTGQPVTTIERAALSVRPTIEKSAVTLDRHPLWLDAMDKLLTDVGFEVVAQATDGDEALDLIDEHRPDAFIAGVDPAFAEQIACIRKATQRYPELKSIVVSDNTGFEAIDAAFAAGASAYCIKTARQEDLASAIRQVFQRSIYLATNGSHDHRLQPSAAEAQPVAHDLTKRELEILKLVAEGHSNSQLAGMLWVTEQTVKFHLSNIYRKLDVGNRTEASRWASVNGLLPNPREERAASDLTPAAV